MVCGSCAVVQLIIFSLFDFFPNLLLDSLAISEMGLFVCLTVYKYWIGLCIFEGAKYSIEIDVRTYDIVRDIREHMIHDSRRAISPIKLHIL
jgi:hypothetical protein